MSALGQSYGTADNKPLFVVTIMTRGYDNRDEIDFEVFDTLSGANRWIGSRIRTLKRKHKDNPNFSVSGWHVELDGCHSVVQFDIIEKVLRESNLTKTSREA